MSEVLATIPMAMEPARVAIAPDGSRAYVTLSELVAEGPDVGAIAVIDTTTRTVVATIPVGSMPAEVVVAPDGKTVYVPCWNGAELQGILSIIDVDEHRLRRTQRSRWSPRRDDHARRQQGLRLHPGRGGRPRRNGKVSVVNTATKRVVVTIPINPFPSAWGSPDGKLVYALDTEGDPAVIDTTTKEATFPFLSSPSETGSPSPRTEAAYMVDNR